MANTLKTGLLLGLLTSFFLFVGYRLGGQAGMVVALLFAIATNLGSWWFSDRIVLTMYRARPVSPAEAPELTAIVQDLARRAGIPTPRLYLLPQAAPNAFATGRDPEHAAVAVTAGLLQLMPTDEVRAVLAHELGHVARRDTLTAAVAASLAGAVTMLANVAQWGLLLGGGRDREGAGANLLLIFLAPLAATIIQLAVSRSREYAADAYAAELIGSGRPLARALSRLESGVAHIPSAAHPETAHLFIVSPLRGGGVFSLFRTHPDTQERIRRLLAIEGRRAA